MLNIPCIDSVLYDVDTLQYSLICLLVTYIKSTSYLVFHLHAVLQLEQEVHYPSLYLQVVLHPLRTGNISIIIYNYANMIVGHHMDNFLRGRFC